MKSLDDLNIEGKKVLLRSDYDVPLNNGKVVDDTRIKASFETIHYVLKRRPEKIVILCHIDRPGGIIVDKLRVAPIEKLLRSLLPSSAPIKVEENLRFNPGEELNDRNFAQSLAQKGEVFINDAFAVSHRSHASIVTLPLLLPSAIGVHFKKEVKALNKVRDNPTRPVVFVIGGAKLKTKLPLIEKIVNLADEILVGGKLAQEIGNTCSPEVMACIRVAQLRKDGRDILEESAIEFAQHIETAGTVVWNGPMGVFESEDAERGTEIIAKAVNNSSGYTVIGGGDTEAAATVFKAENKLDHISMGGGAMLQYLSEGTLPGLNAIEKGDSND